MRFLWVRLVVSFITVCLFFVALQTRTPLFFKFRPWDAISICLLSLFLVVSVLLLSGKKTKSEYKLFSGFLIISLIAIMGMVLLKEAHFHYVRASILSSENPNLQEIGKHFIVGFGDFSEVKKLVEKGAIGGIFITKKNVIGKSKEQIMEIIHELQDLQLSFGRTPLIISTDQEGGVVSKLSPPLTRLPGLASVVEDGEIAHNLFTNFARIHGSELSDIGVNVNFAPVVDINEGVINNDDKHTRIYRRAISDDPGLIGKVASEYCKYLAEYNVICTLKHFPGLGNVKNDTHISVATLYWPDQFSE